MRPWSWSTLGLAQVVINLVLVTLCATHPFPYLRGSRYGYGRNIRRLPCVSKHKETGVCMFAWDCMKANGTHLDTCIDRFYFGSCCKLSPGTQDLSSEITNEIPSGERPTIPGYIPTLKPGVATTAGDESDLKTSTEHTPITAEGATDDQTATSDGQTGTGVGQTGTSIGQSVTPSIINKVAAVGPIEGQTETSTGQTGTGEEQAGTTHGLPGSPDTQTGTTVEDQGDTSPDEASTATEASVAVDPEPTHTDVTVPGITEPQGPESPAVGGSTTVSPGSAATPEGGATLPETEPTLPDLESATPVSAPATETTAKEPTAASPEECTEAVSGSVGDTTIPALEDTQNSTHSVPETGTTVATTIQETGSSELTGVTEDIFNRESTEKPTSTDMPTTPGIVDKTAVIGQTEQPATPSATEKPATPSATEKPATPSATEQPATPTIIDKVAAIGPTVKPATPSVAEQPATPSASEQPATPSVPEQPATPSATEQPEATTVTEMPDMTETSTLPVEDDLLTRLNTSNYKDICGVPVYPTARIVGGNEAAFGEWPWQVSLRQWRQVTFLHKCGAALLNENWAITAAHCVENLQPEQLLLRLGEFDLERTDEPYPYAERKVQIIATHPKFDPRTFEFDLALLRFYEPVSFMPNIIPICVPQDDYSFLNDTGYVTGWGRLYEDGPLPSVLQNVHVPVITNQQCENMYRVAGYVEHIPDIFICAGYEGGRQDSCEGDSGGPLVIQRNGVWNLAGVISWGIGCALPNQPGVYTRISAFREWIEKIIVF